MDYFTMQMLALDIPSHRVDVAFCANNRAGNNFSSLDLRPPFRKWTGPEMSEVHKMASRHAPSSEQ